jgi:hypothetical protein
MDLVALYREATEQQCNLVLRGTESRRETGPLSYSWGYEIINEHCPGT